MKIRSYLGPNDQTSFGVKARLFDSYSRNFSYLRLSITDQCNFRCQYCLPNGNISTATEPAFLSRSEIRRLSQGFGALGFQKVRLTGGEPSLRKDLTEIISDISQGTDIKTVALSTNGFRLAKDGKKWLDAGLSSVNISIDSLNAERFQRITGTDHLSLILKGVYSVLEQGISSLKINAVLLADTDTAEILSFIHFVKNTPVTVRFIELMETSGHQPYFTEQHQSSSRLIDYLQKSGWSELQHAVDAGPAREFSHQDYQGRIGVIAPYSSGFCETCNRLRVTAHGDLRLCLFDSKGHSIRDLLQADDQRVDLEMRLQQLLLKKTSGHSLSTGETGNNYSFSAMGG